MGRGRGCVGCPPNPTTRPPDARTRSAPLLRVPVSAIRCVEQTHPQGSLVGAEGEEAGGIHRRISSRRAQGSTFHIQAAVNRTPARDTRQVPKSGPAGRRSGCTAWYGAFACIASDYPVPTQTSRATCSKADAQRQSSRARRLQRVSCSAELGCITSPASREPGPIRVTTFPSIPLHRTYLTFSDRSAVPA
jgi:hypothetical protein